MKFRKAYSFNDVLLVPKYSNINSRSEVDLSTSIAGLNLKIPIIAANMSSVCEVDMCVALGELGGLGILHRFCNVDDQAEMVDQVKQKNENILVGFSIGVGTDWRDRMDACRKKADIVCLDVAHGHHSRVIELLKSYFGIYKDYPIIIGQLASLAAIKDILNVVPEKYRDNVVGKISVGGGSVCTTRIKTGFGVPTLQAILDVSDAPIDLIADGGIKESGDIVKSLAAGADAVMLGNLLAGTDEAPGRLIKGKNGQLFKEYMGSASFKSKQLRGESNHVEGESMLIPYKGSVIPIINDLLDGIRSGCSYAGARNIMDLNDAEFIEISEAGYKESLPHGII